MLASWRTAILPIAIVVVIAAGIMKTMMSSPREASGSGPPQRITIIYVGADDCAPCRSWHRTYWPSFRDSPEFNRLEYREVRSPNLFEVLNKELWPEDLQGYRNEIKTDSGVPLWLVIADGDIVLAASGISQWRDAVLPAIRQLAR